jgi:RimJ/RimL family protein N-acetyltransferase
MTQPPPPNPSAPAWSAPPWLPPFAATTEHFATTASRIRLRPWRLDDAPALLDAFADPAPYLPWLPFARDANRTLDACRESILRFAALRARTDPPADDFTFAIADRATDTPLGSTGLHRIVHAAHEAEIGYWLHPAHRAQGLATHAVATLISWAFTPQHTGGWGLRRIHIRCAAANAPSHAIPRRLGLTLEARHRLDRWVPTRGWDDTLVFAVLSSEWDCDAHRLVTTRQ